MSVGVDDDSDLHWVSGDMVRVLISDTYTLNGTEPTKLLLQVSLVGIITEPRNNERLEGVASNVGILVGLV